MTSFSSFFVALYSYSFCEVIMYVRSLFQLTDSMLSLKMSNGCICQEDLQFSTCYNLVVKVADEYLKP